jgi:hypothetical protein
LDRLVADPSEIRAAVPHDTSNSIGYTGVTNRSAVAGGFTDPLPGRERSDIGYARAVAHVTAEVIAVCSTLSETRRRTGHEHHVAHSMITDIDISSFNFPTQLQF